MAQCRLQAAARPRWAWPRTTGLLVSDLTTMGLLVPDHTTIFPATRGYFPIRGRARACAGVRGRARACAGVRGRARACAGVRGRAWACASVRAGWRARWAGGRARWAGGRGGWARRLLRLVLSITADWSEVHHNVPCHKGLILMRDPAVAAWCSGGWRAWRA